MVGGSPVRISDAVILLVEDEPDCRISMQRLLRARGWRVFGARHGAEALALLEVTQPDVVLTDIAMPGGDGIELVRQLAERAPWVPVIAFTGLDRGDPRLGEMRAAGCAEILHKPLVVDEIADSLVRALQPRAHPIE